MIRRLLAALMSMSIVLASETPVIATELQQMQVGAVKHKVQIAARPQENLDAAVAAKKARLAELAKPQVRQLTFSKDVSDREIEDCRVFLEPMFPLSKIKSSTAENQALAAALLAFKKKDIEDVSDLKAFLTKYPNSRWAPALEMNLAETCFSTGYFTDAIKYWTSAWESSKNEKQRELTSAQTGALISYLTSTLRSVRH